MKKKASPEHRTLKANNQIKLICVNHDRYDNHDETEAQFYCLLERVYLCETCLEEHRSHQHYADSIKNHLASQFNQWRSLMDHAQTVTKC